MTRTTRRASTTSRCPPRSRPKKNLQGDVEMLVDLGVRQGHITALKGGDDGLVFDAYRTLPIRRGEHGGQTDPRQPRPQPGVGRGQQFAVGGVDERLVETTIQSNERLGR